MWSTISVRPFGFCNKPHFGAGCSSYLKSEQSLRPQPGQLQWLPIYGLVDAEVRASRRVIHTIDQLSVTALTGERHIEMPAILVAAQRRRHGYIPSMSSGSFADADPAKAELVPTERNAANSGQAKTGMCCEFRTGHADRQRFNPFCYSVDLVVVETSPRLTGVVLPCFYLCQQ